MFLWHFRLFVSGLFTRITRRSGPLLSHTNVLPETLWSRNQRYRFCRSASNRSIVDFTSVNFVRGTSRVSTQCRALKTDDYLLSYLSCIRFAATTYPVNRRPLLRACKTIKTPLKTTNPRTNNKLNFKNTKHDSCIDDVSKKYYVYLPNETLTRPDCTRCELIALIFFCTFFFTTDNV